VTTAKDGTMHARHWDGWTQLLSPTGLMPAGLVPRALRLLHKWGYPVQLRDLRIRPDEEMPRWCLPAGFRLRDYQDRAVRTVLGPGRGVIDSPPRSGKTVIIAELVRQLSLPTVITAPTEAIASQTYDKLVELFRENEWGGGRKDCSEDFFLLTGGLPKSNADRRACQRALVYVATDGTAVSMDPSWWERIRVWISDERHHQASRTHRKLNDLAVNAYYRFGFTGTNFRSSEGEHVALEAPLGRTLVQYSVQEMRDRGVLVPARVEFWPIYRPRMRTIAFRDAYTHGIVNDKIRNAAIVYAAQKYREEGRRVLILVNQINHGELLRDAIAGSQFVKGVDGDEVRAAVKRLDAGDLRVLIGSPVVGEGLDCPSADALIYAKGYKARVTHTQDMFRVLTADGRKQDAIILDFADRHNAHLEDHAVARAQNYLAMGLPCTVLPELPTLDGLVELV